MSGRRTSGGAWRRSYDIADPRAQVSTIYWPVSEKNEHAFKFFDVIRKAIWRYSDHIRQPGRTLPICANALRVFEALVSHMDFKTGRCDPSLDTIARRSRLSRRTVVRQLDTLRRQRLIDWKRRTVRTGNAPGEGPLRQQTSNAYFIDLAKLPVEILRTLRQKLGGALRETGRVLEGSGPVPSRLASQAARLVANLTGAFSASGSRERAELRRLAGASQDERLVHMYGGDLEAIRQHREMLGLGSVTSASATLALYPSLRTERDKD